jgi:hypothetical protein
METCEDVQFKQRAFIEFFIVENSFSVDIYRRMHAVYGDKCVDISKIIGWVRHFNILAPEFCI